MPTHPETDKKSQKSQNRQIRIELELLRTKTESAAVSPASARSKYLSEAFQLYLGARCPQKAVQLHMRISAAAHFHSCGAV